MKKLVSAVLAVVFLSASAAFARPEINVKAGLDLANNATMHSEVTAWGYTAKTDNTATSDIGFQFGGEILFPIGSVVKLGGGFAYVAPRQMDKDSKASDPLKVSMVPIYFTLQVNPISAARGVFLKGDIGFSILSFSADDTSDYPSGALYLGIGGGYEFPFGLIVDLAYNYYSSASNSFDSGILSSKTSYSFDAIVLSVGYKFKL